MNAEELQTRTAQNVAQTLGQTTLKMVEAQTAADLLMATNEALRTQVASLQAELAALKGETAAA